ncbi:MAG TPA: RT0821/Lpp0805 family surface protein [Geothermobacteraceae bacterium]|nr:RT0821/Lpp0805 family surface protein [Geothermobacteraceae bacterium]
MLRLITLLFTALVLLAGCAAPLGPREGTGTILGAGTGALLGSQIGGGKGRIVATAAGTLLGALIGQDVGRTLDRADQAYLQRTSQYSLEHSATNQPTSWVNPDTGHRGTVTPTGTYQANDGRYCREFTQTVEINGETQQAYGTACRQPDGSWQLSSAQPQPQVRQQVVVRERVVEPAYPPAYYPSYWPFATSLSFSWVEHSGGHRGGRHYGGHRRHH